MTPLAHVEKAAEIFSNTENYPVYHFVVPDHLSMRYFAQRIREQAKQRGYRWRVVHNLGRAWIIKQRI